MQKRGTKTISRPLFFFFKKTLHELKESGQRLSFVFIYDLGLDILTL